MSEMEELTALYVQAELDGIWIKEWEGIAGAGDLRDLEALAEEAGIAPEAMYERLWLGAVVDIGYPGEGATRIARCRCAVARATLARAADRLPRTVKAREALGLPIAGTKPLGTF